jgi:hypothetical protein
VRKRLRESDVGLAPEWDPGRGEGILQARRCGLGPVYVSTSAPILSVAEHLMAVGSRPGRVATLLRVRPNCVGLPARPHDVPGCRQWWS